MALVPRLELRQTQTLVMTPQLQQAIKLLQLSNLDLSDYIDHELEQNPLLEREDSEGGEIDSGPDTAAETSQDGEFGDREAEPAESAEFGDDVVDQPDSYDLTGTEDMSGTNDAALDTDFENVWNSDSAADSPGAAASDGGASDGLHWQTSGGGGGFDDSGDILESAKAGDISLRDYLVGQINVDLDEPVDRMIALHMIGLLDDSGYLTAELSEAAEALGCTQARIDSTLDKIQRFDPTGIFARDLAECLALQLRELDRFDPAMQALVENLDLLAKRDFSALKKICGVEPDDIADMVSEIKALNPKPAQAFDYQVAQPVTPDVVVRRRADGWAVELNPENLPRVLVNNQYYAEISKMTSDKDKEYIDNCYQSANWLVKALHQRAQTILRVATELVKRQDKFLRHGVQYFKPLVLRDIAQALEIHESTVSRVTNNKYIATPRGIFELKYFFNFALSNDREGDDHSAEAVRFRIKSMIERETADGVLSDDKIVEMLCNDGVNIARRTVAKYREALRIPSSIQRRREKSLNV